MNEYFQPGSVPAPNSIGSSAVIRGQFTAIATAFDKLPTMAGSADEFLLVNSTGTALIASGYKFSDFATTSGIQTLTNKTLSWSNNTWVGFGTGATKNAGTGAGEVLLLAESNKLPALDGSNLTNLQVAALPVVPISKGGTGATTLGSAQTALGIDLKADANNAVLTGAPTAPTPPTGDNSARLANTSFVTATVAAIGGATPSNVNPLMNGVVSPGVAAQVSRDDHVHPVDTSRAPASASTATGTSFTASGGIAATNVQAALVELDTEKAPLASPAFTGTPTAPTPLTSDNDTSVATTAFVQSLLAQQPPGVQVSDSDPLMNGTVTPGTGVEASRYNHVHPVDTSRAANAFTPSGSIAANTVAGAIVELDTEKAPIASPTFTGPVTLPQYLNVTQPYGALQVNGTDAFRFGSDTSGQLAGFRNILINAGFQVNQRAYVSGAVLAAGVYGHDRWKAGASGGDYTFTQLKSATQITIASGKSLIQVIEDSNVVGGSYVLAWTGAAKARVGVNSAAPSGTYSASPILITGQTAGTVASVEFTNDGAGGTLLLPQQEEGAIPSKRENRPIGLELSLCRRYARQQQYIISGYQTTGTVFVGTINFDTPMLTSPTYLTIGSPVYINASVLTVDEFNVDGFRAYATITATGAGQCKFNALLASEL